MAAKTCENIDEVAETVQRELDTAYRLTGPIMKSRRSQATFAAGYIQALELVLAMVRPRQKLTEEASDMEPQEVVPDLSQLEMA